MPIIYPGKAIQAEARELGDLSYEAPRDGFTAVLEIATRHSTLQTESSGDIRRLWLP